MKVISDKDYAKLATMLEDFGWNINMTDVELDNAVDQGGLYIVL